MAYSFHKACLLIHQALLHFETGVAHLGNGRLAGDVVMEMDRHLEVEVDVDELVFN